MQEQENNDTGLHKEISSIFKGVPIPNNDSVQQSSDAPAANHIGCPVPKPPAPEAQNLQNPQAPKPYQLSQPLPEAAAAQQPKTDIEKSPSGRRAAVKVMSQTFLQQIKDRLFAPRPDVGATRQKAMVVLAPVLFIVMVLMLIKVFSSPSRTIAEPAEVKPVNTIDASVYEIDWEIPAPYPTTYRDPMRPGSTITTQTNTERLETGRIGRLIVKSIVYSEDNPSAVIGSRIVHEGEEVLGATVVKINRDSVEFEAGEKRWKQNVGE
ncbi:MAG: hypothetical protein ACYS9C_13195 [Planctomycetota bacterium]|jgi:hypothetical protein